MLSAVATGYRRLFRLRCLVENLSLDCDMPLFDYLIASEGSFDAAAHGIFELAGFDKRYRRPPYHSLADEQMEDLAEFLNGKNFL